MKACWCQGGLHIQPQNGEEGAARTLLVYALRIDITPDDEVEPAIED